MEELIHEENEKFEKTMDKIWEDLKKEAREKKLKDKEAEEEEERKAKSE